MTSQASSPGRDGSRGLRPQAHHGDEVVASARRPKPSFGVIRRNRSQGGSQPQVYATTGVH